MTREISLAERTAARGLEVDGGALAAATHGESHPHRTRSFGRRQKRNKDLAEAAAPRGRRAYFLDAEHKLFDIAPEMLVGELLQSVKARLGAAASNSFALYQVPRADAPPSARPRPAARPPRASRAPSTHPAPSATTRGAARPALSAPRGGGARRARHASESRKASLGNKKEKVSRLPDPPEESLLLPRESCRSPCTPSCAGAGSCSSKSSSSRSTTSASSPRRLTRISLHPGARNAIAPPHTPRPTHTAPCARPSPPPSSPPPQAVNDVQRGNYPCKASDAVKLAAIHYYVWHGPFDATKEQFSLEYMHELRLGEQLMPTPLVTAQRTLTGRRASTRSSEDLRDLLEALGGAGDHGVGGEGDVHQEGAQAADVRHHALPRPQLEDLPVRPLRGRRATRAASSSSTRSRRRSCTRPSSSPTSSGGSTRPKSSASGPPSATSSTMSTRGATSSSTRSPPSRAVEISTTLHSYYKVLMHTDVSVNTSDQPLRAEPQEVAHRLRRRVGSDDDEGGRVARGGRHDDAEPERHHLHAAEAAEGDDGRRRAASQPAGGAQWPPRRGRRRLRRPRPRRLGRRGFPAPRWWRRPSWHARRRGAAAVGRRHPCAARRG